MNIEDTTLIHDIRKVHESAKLKIREEKLVNAGFFDYYDESHDDLFDANILKNSTARRVIHNSYTVRNHPIQSPVCLIEEEFGYIIQVPDAPLKVSEKLPPSNSDEVHDWDKLFFNVDNDDSDPYAAITDIVLL